jgi:hypothetical protein
MGKRGRQPNPYLSSAFDIRQLLRACRWDVPRAADILGLTKSAIYLAMKTYGVTIPSREAKRIRRDSARHAANARWERP